MNKLILHILIALLVSVAVISAAPTNVVVGTPLEQSRSSGITSSSTIDVSEHHLEKRFFLGYHDGDFAMGWGRSFNNLAWGSQWNWGSSYMLPYLGMGSGYGYGSFGGFGGFGPWQNSGFNYNYNYNYFNGWW